MDARRVLVVEDNPDINALLAKIAEREGYRSVQAYSGTEARLQLEHAAFDLVLLDVMLPGMDGAALLALVRDELRSSVPVIVVSAKAGAADKVDLLTLGADDYVTKPFDAHEVAARMHAVLRRCDGREGAGAPEADGEAYDHRGLHLDVARRRVALKGAEVALTAHEFDILHVLMQAPDRVFSRELLYELVWKSGYYGEQNAVNVHVSNIRKKLAAVDADADYIKTVWGIGFKLA
ncbi:response regulator transcription factor [Eggerthella sinensis]|uniref:response regulator transcription factor n=1 Tax=Eggerthella sinensis TaxID=242230 RepID=UPI00248EE8BD|nr:response regulator transcription factor [Eggerthella sinensis]